MYLFVDRFDLKRHQARCHINKEQMKDQLKQAEKRDAELGEEARDKESESHE